MSFDEIQSSYRTLHFIPIHPVFISRRTSKTFIFISIHYDHQPPTKQFRDNSRTCSPTGCSIRFCRRGLHWCSHCSRKPIWIRGKKITNNAPSNIIHTSLHIFNSGWGTTWLYVNHSHSASAIVAERLSIHVLQFMYPRFLPLLQYYDHTTTADAQWFLLEHNVRGGNGVMRIPIDTGNIYDYYHSSLSNDHIFAIWKTRLSKNIKMDGSYKSQVSH